MKNPLLVQDESKYRERIHRSGCLYDDARYTSVSYRNGYGDDFRLGFRLFRTQEKS